jgi:hypothetical protein
MLRELIQYGGDNYVTQILKQDLFHAAKAEISRKAIALPTNAYIKELIDRVVIGIKAGDFSMRSATRWRRSTRAMLITKARSCTR